jgi:DnaJ homologue, subfamily C, member 28, conserved domain
VPIRRDGEGKPAVGPTWESLTERLIREAMERGEFDDLPYKGERLPIDDDTYAGDKALAFHVLRNAGAAPPWRPAASSRPATGCSRRRGT